MTVVTLLITPIAKGTEPPSVDKGYPQTVWCLVGNGATDPYSSPYIIPNNSLYRPFPHSLLRPEAGGILDPKGPRTQWPQSLDIGAC